MFPIRDNVPSRTTPVVTGGVIAAAAVIWLWQASLLPGEFAAVAYRLGVVPLLYADAALRHDLSWLELATPFVTSVFLHGSWMHAIGNLWMLWIFGDNVEDFLGRTRYLLFYLTGGAVAAGVQVLATWGSPSPTIGASGAIAAVMGAYLVLYPRAQVLTLIPLLIVLIPIALPAVVFIGGWSLLQFVSGTFSLLGDADGGVAWWAHIGGFAFGVATVRLWGTGHRKAQALEPWMAGRRVPRQPRW